ncbi:arginine decarboxylase [Bdellovibrio bacteriovorus]|uniref:Biosynthetic arginine decarboxylase n=1 Tax=Bdellovibrio bacteriovorus TaxID=959 RepID=A0A150WRT0_BDEBC|nr:biosynthetic arginine decarboxylase [Bdellovibrio bacteriovorus]KYG67027.1 arginine decarboxylase [Bdellovibrio bacteriovorus]
MSNWSPEKSAALYGINNWGNGYFRINGAGNVSVTPMGASGPSVDLYELTQDLLDRGIRVPIMIRFPEIIKSRVELLNGCFQKAFADHGYKGNYCGVYPIKVNQQRHLVQELVKYGKGFKMGLECGSKPELLVVLALMNTENALIICNGFKDVEYIETAILSQKLGRNTIIVVDRKEELQLIINAAKKFNTRPKIGFRAKLNTQGAGKWVDSSGARSKFGLTAVEIVEGVELLKKEGMLDCLELLHYHIGSQVPQIQSIKSSLKEGARFYTELYKMGAGLKYIDVGGGLGIDYDGSGHSDSSVNYSEQEYANDIVSVLQTLCDEKEIPHPSIVTESGRFLVAHHSVLVFNVMGVNDLHRHEPPRPATKTDPSIMRDMQYIFEKVNKDNINECFNDLEQAKQETLQLFTYGVLTLEQRAWCESMYFAISTKMVKIAKTTPDTEDIISSLSKELCDTYYSNFSLFQSLPDSWAVGQLFPVIPIHRLGEEPVREATLADLTCDSDGVIEKFIDTESGEPKETVRLHQFTDGQQYYLGVFLTGAYQEILGDLHNLFGDTDAVHISLNDMGYTIDHYVPGDTVTEVLSYVQYGRSEMVDNVRQATEDSIQKGSITKQEAKLLIKHYEEGLSGYTYLEEPE